MSESRAVHFTKRRHPPLVYTHPHLLLMSTFNPLPSSRTATHRDPMLRKSETDFARSFARSKEVPEATKRRSVRLWTKNWAQNSDKSTAFSRWAWVLWLLPETSRCVRIRKFLLLVLRSESQSGKRTNLHTVAACNNRVHTLCSLYYCLFAPHIFVGVIFHAHPVSGESHIQCNANR